MSSQFKKILFLIIIIGSSFFWFESSNNHAQNVFAADANQGITVNANVPGGNGGGGGGGGDTGGGKGGTDVPPVIFDVASSVSFTSATISWSATDDLGVSASSFVYGLTASYGSSGSVSGTYVTNLFGLATNTLYFFKISAVDTKSQVTEYTGTFTTSPNPPDTTPPVISNIQVSAGVTTATIKWDTNELADSQINYGLTNSYGSNYFDSTGILNHSVSLSGLVANKTYHFQIISTDNSGNSANTIDDTFITKVDNAAPPDVSNFNLTTTTNSIILSWTNPSLLAVPDFLQVKVVRKIGSPSADASDGTIVYSGSGENFTDSSVLVNTDYFYTIFSFDTSDNSSPGIFRNGKIFPTQNPNLFEICGNGLDDDSNGQIDCADSACSFLPECLPITPTTTAPVPEICGNGLDDDANGKIDCADSACSGFSGCISVATVSACSNGKDDDGDGKIDFPSDVGCDNPDDTDEYNPPESTVPVFAKIKLEDLDFLAGNRHLKLDPVNGIVTGLSGANLTIALADKFLVNSPKNMVLRVGDTDQHQFVYSATDKTYYAEVSFNGTGLTQSYIEIDYGSGQLDSVGFKLSSLSWGQVVDENDKALSEVEVKLLEINGSVLSMDYYGQLNPIISDINGSFGWMAPNKDYQVSLHKEGYYDRTISLGSIINNVINFKFVLIAKPLKNPLKIDPDISVQENAANIVKNLAAQTKVLSNIAVQKIQDAAASPEVQKTNQQVVAPAAITAVVAGAIPFVSWLDVLPFLRLLFLQPLMLLGWRKREKWGLVYNSLNKLPVDLATVRLISAETNRIVQSKVTDAKGRFIFTIDPGKYKLEVQKTNFVFPSQFLQGYASDGQKIDIYHGEEIEIFKPATITANIPLDPLGAAKKPSRLAWEKFARQLQVVIAWSGILVTAVSFYISPKPYIGILLAIHIIFFIIFHKLAIPSRPKNWGIVSDNANEKPVSRVIARLFNSQFNKLVDTQVTDAGGKYYFLAGDAKYYVTYEHKGYHPQKTDVINLEGKDADVITIDVKLKKN
ncbi:MAG TPA: hypothetical protein VLK22_03405 [Candidatus Udaeobacter sp.]|nr:hypothetical protein [Candidatus Udaeobacter sp.]